MPAERQERLQKLLARAGVASRRASETLIEQGKVTVNGKVITELGFKADPDRDRIEVEGKPLAFPQLETVLLYKPRGVVTSCDDPQGRRTVMELVPPLPGLHPIGRLDRDSEGLLLLTNDGALTALLTHPRHEVGKTYRAWVHGHPSPQALKRLREGIELEDGMTQPAEAHEVKVEPEKTLLEITIHEGRNRQVRRMCEAIGHSVLRLKRVRLGSLELGTLRPGEHRRLTSEEIEQLRAAATALPKGGHQGP
ncbi:MAG: pseudouridine synthase [Bacteroidota bacterium]